MTTQEIEVISREQVRELETDISNLTAQVKGFQVLDEDSYSKAGELLSWIAVASKNCEEKRKFFVKPLNDHVSRINLLFKNYSEPLASLRQELEPKMLKYRQDIEEARRLEEAEQKVDNPDLPVPAPVEQPKTTFNSIGAVSAKKVWTWKISDINKVPREHMILDEKKINALVRAGIRDIPGIEIYQQEKLAVR